MFASRHMRWTKGKVIGWRMRLSWVGNYDECFSHLGNQAGGYVFQLVIRSSEGRLRRLTLDARTPFGDP